MTPKDVCHQLNHSSGSRGPLKLLPSNVLGDRSQYCADCGPQAVACQALQQVCRMNLGHHDQAP